MGWFDPFKNVKGKTLVDEDEALKPEDDPGDVETGNSEAVD